MDPACGFAILDGYRFTKIDHACGLTMFDVCRGMRIYANMKDFTKMDPVCRFTIFDDYLMILDIFDEFS